MVINFFNCVETIFDQEIFTKIVIKKDIGT